MKHVWILLALFPFAVGAQNFGPAVSVAEPWGDVNAVISADLDGDGDEDLVVAGRPIAWMSNLGNGDFSAPIQISSDVTTANQVWCLDLNNDQDLDILCRKWGSNTVFWYPNLGSGTFGERINVDEGVSYSSAVPYDLDADQDMDILVSNSVDDELLWFENAGDGTFSPAATLAEGLINANLLALGDLDGDDDMDLVYSSSLNDNVGWFRNNGDLTFSEEAEIAAVNTFFSSLTLGDADGDGDLDVFAHFENIQYAVWYENQGDGTFSGQHTILQSEAGLDALFLHDMDNDEDLDLLTQTITPDGISWRANDGTGSFGEPTFLTSEPTFGVVMALGNLNGDATADLLWASSIDRAFGWMAGSATGGFEEPAIIAAGTPEPQAVAVGDLNGDGLTDMVSSLTYFGIVVWYPQLEDGSFGLRRKIAPVSNADHVSVVDLNNDEHLDVLVHSLTGSFAWYANDGEGNFEQMTTFGSSDMDVKGLHFEDLNQDGYQDLMVSPVSDGAPHYYMNDGDGGFEAPLFLPNDYGSSSSNRTIDADGDGDLDVVATGIIFGTTENFHWYENDGDGSMIAAHPIEIEGVSMSELVCEDFTGDGVDDIMGVGIFQETWTTYFYLFQNDGQGHFEGVIASEALSGASTNYYWHAADLNNDGALDLVADRRWVNAVVYMNDGSGFLHELPETEGPQTLVSSDLVLSDIDNDGLIDIAFTSENTDTVAWYPNTLQEGCTDPAACNYNPDAWIDNGACMEADAFAAFDADQNGIVGAADFLAIIADFGCTGDNCVGDVNNDGEVGTSDLVLVLGVFGVFCP